MQVIRSTSCLVDVCVNENPIKKYGHLEKTFVCAVKGQEYSVRIKNNGYSRVLVVVSIDGVNCLDGTQAGTTKAGYVIHGYSSYSVKGFRTSNDSVNTFKFSDKQNSYAAKISDGDESNCGVIGVEIFEEKVEYNYNYANFLYSALHPIASPAYPGYDYNRFTFNNISDGPHSALRACNLSNSSHSASAPDFDVGTEFSKPIEDKVVDTEFQIGKLQFDFEIFYASKEALIKLGVPVAKETGINFPKAFPGRFCQPPK